MSSTAAGVLFSAEIRPTRPSLEAEGFAGHDAAVMTVDKFWSRPGLPRSLDGLQLPSGCSGRKEHRGACFCMAGAVAGKGMQV